MIKKLFIILFYCSLTIGIAGEDNRNHEEGHYPKSVDGKYIMDKMTDVRYFKIFNPLILVPKFLIPHNWDTSPWKVPAYYPMGINKIVVMMWINVIILILFFSIGYNKKKKVQSGFGNLLEILVVFVRDEVVYENLGKEQGKK